MLIREKACGEEIDAILAPSQPPLVTALPAGGRTLRATLRCLTVANTQPPHVLLQLLRAVPLRPHRLCARGEQLPSSKAGHPACIVTVEVNCVCLLPFGPLVTRVSRGPTGISSSARRFPVNASCSSRPVYLWLRLKIALWLGSSQ